MGRRRSRTALHRRHDRADYRKLAQTPGAVAAKRGEADKALAECALRVESEFEFPYLAHAPMEPLNCVIELTDDGG